MDYKFKQGQRVRILDVESLGDNRSVWAGRELTLATQDTWDEPAWSVEEPVCYYRFRESEMAPLGPIRTETVTVRRIEPGVYGRLSVAEDTAPHVSIALTSPDGTEVIERYRRSFSAPELRELARVALEIAEYLENVD